MTVHYAYLAFALLLLWAPRNWLRLGLRTKGKASRRAAETPPDRDPQDRTVRPLAEAAKSRNWLDFFRALVGGYVVMKAAFQAPAGMDGGQQETVVAQGVVLLVGLIVQMVRMEGRLSLFAPIFYLQGMSIAVAGGLTGVLAMAGSWALTPVLPGAGAVLFVQGGLVLSFGLMFGDVVPLVIFMVASIIWLPVLLSVLLRKRLSASFDKRVKVVGRDARPRAEAGVGSGAGAGGEG